MTENVLPRTPGTAPSAGLRSFPAVRPSETFIYTPSISAGRRSVVRGRCFRVWLSAALKQGAHAALVPLLAALVGMETLWRKAGRRLWATVYAIAVLVTGAVTAAAVGAAGLSHRAGQFGQSVLSRLGRKFHARLNVLILFGVGGLFLILTAYYTLGLEVIVGGRSLGFVSSQSEYLAAVNRVSERASQILQYPYQVDSDVVYQYSIVDRHAVFDRTEVEDMLFSQIPSIKKLHVLTVDGKTVAASADREGLQSILDTLLARYDMDGQADEAFFRQDVRIEYQWADADQEKPLSEVRLLLSGQVRKTQYDVAGENDSIAAIALRNGMSEADLLALNGVGETDLMMLDAGEDEASGGYAGQRFVVGKAIPFLSVVALRQIQYEEEIPYASSTITDNTIYDGDRKIRVQGVPGTALVTADLEYVNGEETGRIERSRTTATLPVDEVIAIGTKKRPPKAPTGKLIRPFWGKLTSGFGSRSLFGSTRMHEGIDLAGPVGSPIVAADGGTVSFSGTKNGYGLCIIINHGNGFTTLYGHCSQLLVTEGQQVAKGELIAKVGNTGRSTGPHLHFETRVDGTPVNPWSYIK